MVTYNSTRNYNYHHLVKTLDYAIAIPLNFKVSPCAYSLIRGTTYFGLFVIFTLIGYDFVLYAFYRDNKMNHHLDHYIILLF